MKLLLFSLSNNYNKKKNKEKDSLGSSSPGGHKNKSMGFTRENTMKTSFALQCNNS